MPRHMHQPIPLPYLHILQSLEFGPIPLQKVLRLAFWKRIEPVLGHVLHLVLELVVRKEKLHGRLLAEAEVDVGVVVAVGEDGGEEGYGPLGDAQEEDAVVEAVVVCGY